MKHELKSAIFSVLAIALWSTFVSADEAAWIKYSDAGKRAYEKKDFSESENMYRLALKEAEELGEQDTRLATSLNNLAEAYFAQAKFDKAEPLHKRALELKKRILGPEHPDLVMSLGNLSKLYSMVGRYDKAEPLLKQALKIISQKTFKAEELASLESLDRLAEVFRNQERYSDAKLLYKNLLDLKEHTLGKEHPDVAEALNSLADVCRSEKNYSEAESLYKLGLEIREKTLGTEHLAVADSLLSLADNYKNQDRRTEAETLYKRAMAIKEKIQGPEKIDYGNLSIFFNDVKAPKITKITKPNYTALARESGINGKVVFTALFSKDGTISDIKLVRILGFGLDQEALKAAMKIKFIPGEKDGNPVNVRGRLEFTFSLR
jgi:TonB family protein